MIFVLLIFLLSFPAMTQEDVPFDKNAFPPEQKEAFKEAVKHIKEGNKYYEDEHPKYEEALDHFLKANDFNPDNALLNYRIGRCYQKTFLKTKSVQYLEEAYQLNPHVARNTLFLIAHGYHLKLEFEKAIKIYEEYKGSLGPEDLAKEGGKIDKRITECKVGIEMVKDPVRIFVDNLGSNINTKNNEYGPYINADETVLMFTSARPNTTGGKTDPNDGNYYEDIYISKWLDGKWSRADNPRKPLNRDNHDAIVGVSPDGKHALIFIGEANGGDIYECRVREDDEWRAPRKLPKEINTKYHESAASFSPDMDALYFVSDRPGGFGGKDIYHTELRIKGNREKLDYEEAENLGAIINTPEDEISVFMDVDGKTLYFSSKGHESMGGFDIFKSTFSDGKWSKPENLGYPINTPDNDRYFSISKDGKHAYYSTFDPSGYGKDDIYMITLLGTEKPVEFMEDYDLIAHKTTPILEKRLIADRLEIQESQITIVHGRILDALTMEPLGSVPVEIYDNMLGMMVNKFESTSNGEYTVSLNSGKNYGFSARPKDYMFHSENLIIPPATTVQEISLDMLLHKVKVGSKIILKNIFFDFNKATLRSESATELNRLEKMLTDVLTLKIEISGHTDNVGTNEYNKQLSEARAKAVVDYLIEKGISKGRLSYVGYGETEPIKSNDKEEGRQMNRRTEFKVLSK